MIQQTNKYALCKFSKTVSTTATCKGTNYSTILIEQIEVKVKITLQKNRRREQRDEPTDR
jgi:hypothetical protein